MQCYAHCRYALRGHHHVSVRYLRGYAVLLPAGAGVGAPQRFQSAICADMQCYTQAAADALDDMMFQSAICADMQCY